MGFLDEHSKKTSDAERRVLHAALNVLLADNASLEDGETDEALDAQEAFDEAAQDALVAACRNYIALIDQEGGGD